MLEFSQHPCGSTLKLRGVPKRIISLVPSITETLILFDVMPVGRSSFCIEPKNKIDAIVRVGGTKTPNINKIRKLHPDLVIANLEENRKEDVEMVRSHDIPVWVTFPKTMQDTYGLLQELGQLSSSNKAQLYVSEFESFIETSAAVQNISILVLIWKKPWMAVGRDTYTDYLLSFSGASNACDLDRYPELSENHIRACAPDILLLPTEPYPFDDNDLMFWKAQLPKTSVYFFSGEDLFWSGQRAPNACHALLDLLKWSKSKLSQEVLK